MPIFASKLLALAAASIRLTLVIAAVCSVLIGSADARSCTAEERETADRQLRLNKRDREAAVTRHLPWGVPKPTVPVEHEQILAQRDYIVNHDDDLLTSVWTAHRLDKRRLKKMERVDCFRRDPRINAPAAALPADYREPIFDQGHLSPNSDMTFTLNAALNSFVLSNMAPQYCQFNRGVWQIFESIVRLWVRERNTVYVITGSVFDRNDDQARDADSAAKRMKSTNGRTRVAVPSHFYKVLASVRPDGSLDVLSVLLLHDQTDLDGDAALEYLGRHVRPLATVEKVAGVKFFPDATVTLHEAAAPNLWPITGKPNRTLVDDRCRTTAGLDR